MAQADTTWSRWAIVTCLSAELVVALAPERAAACSPDSCRRGYFLPRDGGKIPASAKALAWKMSEHDDDDRAQELHLERLDGAPSDAPTWTLEKQADGTYWIKLGTELSPGGRYRLYADGDCSHMAVEFEVTEAAEVPETLGEVEVSPVAAGSVVVGTVSGSCSNGVQAVHAEVQPRLSAVATPWADLLTYETMVDGAAYRPRTSVVALATPDLAPIVFAECRDRYPPGEKRDEGAFDADLPEGEHTVSFEARIPGVQTAIASSSARVTLECDAWSALPHYGGGEKDDGGDRQGDDGEDRTHGAKSSSDCSLRVPSVGTGERAACWLALTCLWLVARRATRTPRARS